MRLRSSLLGNEATKHDHTHKQPMRAPSTIIAAQISGKRHRLPRNDSTECIINSANDRMYHLTLQMIVQIPIVNALVASYKFLCIHISSSSNKAIASYKHQIGNNSTFSRRSLSHAYATICPAPRPRISLFENQQMAFWKPLNYQCSHPHAQSPRNHRHQVLYTKSPLSYHQLSTCSFSSQADARIPVTPTVKATMPHQAMKADNREK